MGQNERITLNPGDLVSFTAEEVATAWDAGHAAAWKAANERIAQLEERLINRHGDAGFVQALRVGLTSLPAVR